MWKRSDARYYKKYIKELGEEMMIEVKGSLGEISDYEVKNVFDIVYIKQIFLYG